MKAAGEKYSAFIWRFVGNRPIRSDGQTPATRWPESEALSAGLKQRGYKFVGPVIVYA